MNATRESKTVNQRIENESKHSDLRMSSESGD